MLFSAKIGLIYVYIIDASLNHFQGEFLRSSTSFICLLHERGKFSFLRGLDMPS